FRCFQRNDAAVDRDRRLAGVDDPDRPRRPDRGVDVAPFAPAWSRIAERPGRHDQLGRHLMRADHAHTALLEKTNRPGEDIVVAADDDREKVLEAPHRSQVEPDALEVRTRADAANEHKITSAARLQYLVETSKLAPIEKFVGKGGDRL